MKVLELVNQKKELDYRAKNLQLRIEELKNNPYTSGGGDVRVKSTVKNSPQENIMMQIVSLEEKLLAIYKAVEKIEDEIDQELMSILDLRTRWIVKQRLFGKQWKEIDSDYSASSIKRYFYKGLDELKEKE